MTKKLFLQQLPCKINPGIIIIFIVIAVVIICISIFAMIIIIISITCEFISCEALTVSARRRKRELPRINMIVLLLFSSWRKFPLFGVYVCEIQDSCHRKKNRQIINSYIFFVLFCFGYSIKFRRGKKAISRHATESKGWENRPHDSYGEIGVTKC